MGVFNKFKTGGIRRRMGLELTDQESNLNSNKQLVTPDTVSVYGEDLMRLSVPFNVALNSGVILWR